MQQQIRRYPVKHPLLKKYIRFFWEIRADHMHLNHKIIPQRNINLRFNLSSTPQYIHLNGKDHLADGVFFSGMQEHYINARMKMNGRIDMLGICFFSDGFYPMLNVPVCEFKNKIFGAGEVSFKRALTISEQLREIPDTAGRLNLLENWLVLLFSRNRQIPENFRLLFNTLNQCNNQQQISELCRRNNISVRSMERMYNKYVGMSAKKFIILNRFQNSLNQILHKDYYKLSDVAYGNGYFDQMHFIRDFKRFAGNTPGNFINQNNSMLQIGKLT